MYGYPIRYDSSSLYLLLSGTKKKRLEFETRLKLLSKKNEDLKDGLVRLTFFLTEPGWCQ